MHYMKPDLNPMPQRLCNHCGRWLWLVAYHGHKCLPHRVPANTGDEGAAAGGRLD